MVALYVFLCNYGCALSTETAMNTALIIANVLAAAAFISLFF